MPCPSLFAIAVAPPDVSHEHSLPRCAELSWDRPASGIRDSNLRAGGFAHVFGVGVSKRPVKSCVRSSMLERAPALREPRRAAASRFREGENHGLADE